MAPLTLRLYDDVRSELFSGYVALARPDSLEGVLITRGTHQVYSHATLLGWTERRRTLMMGETREGRGGRLIAARAEIARSPAGCYDVYRVRSPRYNGHDAWWFACESTGEPYGWRNIARVAVRRVLGWDWVPPILNSDEPQFPRDCSALVHAGLRNGGGPRLRQYDCDVTPGDFSDPLLFGYVCTLVATEAQFAALQKLLDNPRLWFPNLQPLASTLCSTKR